MSVLTPPDTAIAALIQLIYTAAGGLSVGFSMVWHFRSRPWMWALCSAMALAASYIFAMLALNTAASGAYWPGVILSLLAFGLFLAWGGCFRSYVAGLPPPRWFR